MIIIGYDPGTYKFGLTFMDVTEDGEITSIRLYQVPVMEYLKGDLSYPEPTYRKRHEEAIRCMDTLVLSLPEKPIVCAYEIPHFDNKSPGSYGILIHHIEGVKEHIENAYKIPCIGYRPVSIKKTIGASKKLRNEKSKDAVMRCMMATKEVTDHLGMDLSNYGEDAIDSVLIAYTYLVNNR